MKKIIFLISILFFATVSQATEIVQVVWPFGPGTNHAIIMRELIEHANRNQNKYKFIFINKQGAGGVIAANYVLENSNTLLANSSSFFTTPYTLSGQYNIDNFSMVGEFCSNRPIGLFSKKFNDLTNKKEVSVGVVPGTIFDLAASILIEHGYNITKIPFKSVSELRLAVLGGHIDYDFNFLSSDTDADENRKLLLVTGKNPIGSVKTFQTLGIKPLESIVVDLFLFSPSSVPINKRKEFHDIFVQAHNEKTTLLCEKDYGQVTKTEFKDIDERFRKNKKVWNDFFQKFKK